MVYIRKSVLVWIVAAAFTLGLAGATALQEGEGPGKGDAEDDSGSFRLPTPIVDPELGKLVGRWQWEGKIFNLQTGVPKPMKSEDEWKWGLNGQFLFLEFQAPDAFGPGKPMRGLWIVRPEGEGKYRAWWFDVSGTVEVSDGELKEGKFTFTGQSNWGVSRSVFSISENGSYESSSYMKGQEGEWILHLEGKAKKVE